MVPAMLRAATVILIAIVHLAAGDVAGAIDQWYVGELAFGEAQAKPAVSLHLVSTPVSGGGFSTLAELAVVLRRPMLGKEFRIEIRQRQELVEDAEGRITGFRIDHDENGQRTTATGVVKDGKAIAEVAHQGRLDKQVVDLPPEVSILGQIASQRKLAAAVAAAPDGKPAPVEFAGLELVSHRIALVRSKAVYVTTEPDGGLRFTVTSDILPVPSTMVVNRRGDLSLMTVELAYFKVVIRPAPGPVALLGAQVNAMELVGSKGPSPKGGVVELYRLPHDGAVVEDEFQNRNGDVVAVMREARALPLADPAPFLAREPQLEIDDPAMRAWVEGLVAGKTDKLDIAEDLRLAVRSHITSRDFSVSDGTALDTFRNRSGDCTEHANLLCAALRIAGIPARVDVGVVHPQEMAHWAGHAWVSAWIDGRWRHLDAAYPGVARSCYLRLGSSSGVDGIRTYGAMIAGLTSLMGKDIEALGGRP